MKFVNFVFHNFIFQLFKKISEQRLKKALKARGDPAMGLKAELQVRLRDILAKVRERGGFRGVFDIKLQIIG